ncbi:MAG TPA: hypothetical protein VN715_05275 [Roseiarcus sp.]|nr:hypothetical protein [Roseiarcus sp.]
MRKAALVEAERRLADLMIGVNTGAFIRLHAVRSYISLNLPQLARQALQDILDADGLAVPAIARVIADLAHQLGMPDAERRSRDRLAGV